LLAPNDSILKSTDRNSGYRVYFRNNGNNITIERFSGGFWAAGICYFFAIVDSTSLTIKGHNGMNDKRIDCEYDNRPSNRYEFIPLNLSDKADW
jgi:hypothetical protein